ncbi:MAG: N-acetyltransferase [Alphaproteobacteria bacterium]
MTASGSPGRRDPGLHIEAVAGRAGRARFVRVPWPLYADDPNWIPPLLAERCGHLNPKRNPYFADAEAAFWIAVRNGRDVGRISAQVNHAHLRRHDDGAGHFGFLDAEDDEETFRALLATAEDWLRARGMAQVIGPFSLSINDECGLLVRGFDTPPSLMMGHAWPYYARRIEEQGYAKVKDLLAYDYGAELAVPPAIEAFAARVHKSANVRLRPLRKDHYAEDLQIILDIFNDAWSDNWGFVPLSSTEIEYLTVNLKPLIHEKLVCIAEIDDQPAAMAVSLPNLNEAIADLDGRLLPVGWLKLLWRLKRDRMRSARVALMGVRRRYRESALGAALAYTVVGSIYRENVRRGYTRAELSWILEDNTAMRRMIETLGGEAYKTYRIYGKALR